MVGIVSTDLIAISILTSFEFVVASSVKRSPEGEEAEREENLQESEQYHERRDVTESSRQ